MPQLTAPDGTALVYDAYEPASPAAAVLFLTGWSDHGGRWVPAATRLRDAGYATFVLDQRGHGRSGGGRGHLSRFSQLLGDLQAFRRSVRQRTAAPQVLLGHSFGGLVVLRYLETQPLEPIAAAVISSPFLGLAFEPPGWKLAAGRLLADLWPTVALPTGVVTDHMSRDPAVNETYAHDPLVHQRMTASAWREIQWAQRAVPADAARIETPLQFLLAGEDHLTDAHLARGFAGALKTPVEVRWYPEMYHEVLNDPQRERVLDDVLAFLGARITFSEPR
jgi:alpha-beta hydrolase superfamily lysophospholipase